MQYAIGMNHKGVQQSRHFACGVASGVHSIYHW